MTISASRASPSQARGEGEEEVAQPLGLGWCGSSRWRWWWRSPPGRGVRLGFRVEEVVRLGVLGRQPSGVPHPSPPHLK